MLEAVKEYLGQMLLCAAFFVFGAVTVLLVKPDEKGIYMVISWMGNEVFALGKNTLTLSSLDLNNLSETNSKILASELEKLLPDHVLSKYLIELSSRRRGPFKPVDLKQIQVIFVDDTESVHGQLAMACRESAIFGRRAYLYDITSPRPEVVVNGKHLKDFYVEVEQDDFSECTNPSGGGSAVWVDRKAAKEWLGLNDEHLPYVYATVRIQST